MNRFQVEYSETNKETKHTLGQDCWSYLDRRANEGERERATQKGESQENYLVATRKAVVL